MASTLQSPGVQILEQDASVVVTGLSTSVGGTVGVYQWGPVMVPMLISNEVDLVTTFGKPNDSTFGSFFSAANFLAYTSAMWVTRADTTGSLNSTAVGTGLSINNIDVWESSYSTGQAAVGVFAARYPGTMGNGILVSIADSATFATWAYKDQFRGAPGTSDYATSKGALQDEMHVIVIDAAGKFTGTPGSTLEKFEYVSKGSDAISYQGLTNYYVNVLRNQSSYVHWMDHPVGGTNWGNSVIATTFTTLVDTITVGYDFSYLMAGGIDNNAPTNGELQLGWDIYKATETYDISLFVTGNANTTVAKYVIDNIAEVRKDSVVFVSAVTAAGGPIFSSSATAIADATTFKTAMGNSTYAVIDSGYKYMYDKYSDKYRWIALNPDVAGLCAKVDANQDTWFSPAGLTKGQIRGAIKLAWNPNQSQRDALYKISINPVVSFVGQGTLLYGDKTATLKPSAFDRINVRRLFISLEKSIARSAKFQLFEQNDSITRQQFIASVEPFLRDVQGRRGIEAFMVVCDETNNPPQVVSANEFRGDIKIVPIYSVNFVTLTFTAANSAVNFTTF
jgi:Phage tail sheath protein subtilisin-like domain/Phage tail sheath C-terminal domain